MASGAFSGALRASKNQKKLSDVSQAQVRNVCMASHVFTS
jgi:hypothetical protein